MEYGAAFGSGEQRSKKKSKESFRRSFNPVSAWQPSAKDGRRGNSSSKGSQGSGLVPNTQPLKECQRILPKEQGDCTDCVPCHFSSLQGHLATCGLVQCLGTLMDEDSVLVKVLKRQGAIPFAMTNVPQSLFR